MAQLTRGTEVTVNAVLPGPTASEGVSDFVAKLATDAGQTSVEFEREFFRSVRPTSLWQRFGTVEEVANLVAYLSSPLAGASSGPRCEGRGLLAGSLGFGLWSLGVVPV